MKTIRSSVDLLEMEKQQTETEPLLLYTSMACIMYKSLLGLWNELPHYFNSKLNISDFTSLFLIKTFLARPICW